MMLIKLFLFFLIFLVVFSSSLKQAQFVALMHKLDVLIVVYTPRVYLIEVKIKFENIYLFFFVNQLILDHYNNVAYKALLV